MIIDILIMVYVLLVTVLIFQAEKLKKNSLTVVIIGILFTPIVGFGLLAYYQKQLSHTYE